MGKRRIVITLLCTMLIHGALRDPALAGPAGRFPRPGQDLLQVKVTCGWANVTLVDPEGRVAAAKYADDSRTVTAIPNCTVLPFVKTPSGDATVRLGGAEFDVLGPLVGTWKIRVKLTSDSRAAPEQHDTVTLSVHVVDGSRRSPTNWDGVELRKAGDSATWKLVVPPADAAAESMGVKIVRVASKGPSKWRMPQHDDS